MTIIPFPNAPTGPRLVRIQEQSSCPQSIGEAAASALKKIEEDRALALALEADGKVIQLHKEIHDLADRAIFIGRNYDRREQVTHVFSALLNKIKTALMV